MNRHASRLSADDSALRARLESLILATDLPARIAADPIRFPWRYSGPRDIEIAAMLAALLAFGRVELFGPVIDRALTSMDAAGGPARFIADYEGDVLPLAYRWFRPADFSALFLTMRSLYERHPSLGSLFPAAPLADSLGLAVKRLRSLAPVGTSTAFATWFPSPADGSACKRWCMLLRWMVRREAPDIGLWTHIDPAELIIPLDTHVMRVSRHAGLTTRNTPGWATACDITAALRRFDAADPTRYDFALAHLGIAQGVGIPLELTEVLLPSPRSTAARR